MVVSLKNKLDITLKVNLLNTKEKIKDEIIKLAGQDFFKLEHAFHHKDPFDSNNKLYFNSHYQEWYSRSLKVVGLLGKDRFDEFKSYYLPNPKRKEINRQTFVIQDFVKKTFEPDFDPLTPTLDEKKYVVELMYFQRHILTSLQSRVDSILEDVEGHLLAELQDKELEAAQTLLKINIRASGALAGVVLEQHLQRVAMNHGVIINKKNPTISDLNDPIKNEGIYDQVVWRKIQVLGDIRNLCAHKKDREPTKDEVMELLSGTGIIVKTIF